MGPCHQDPHTVSTRTEVREAGALRRSTFRVLPDGLSGASRPCTPLSPRHCSRSASASERRRGKRGPGLGPYLHEQPEQQRRHPPGQAAHGSGSSPGVPCYRVAGASQQHVPSGAGDRAGVRTPRQPDLGARGGRRWRTLDAPRCPRCAPPRAPPPTRARSRHARLGSRPRAPGSQPGRVHCRWAPGSATPRGARGERG